MKKISMSPETRLILQTVEQLMGKQVLIGSNENLIKKITLGWWGNEDTSQTTRGGDPYYDTVMCYFSAFIIRICKFEYHSLSIDKYMIFADSLVDQDKADYDLINKGVNALTEILESQLTQLEFVKREFVGNIGWSIQDDI